MSNFYVSLQSNIIKCDILDTVSTNTLTIGESNATKTEISSTGVTTEIQGPLNPIEAVTFGTGGTSYIFPTTRGSLNDVLKINGTGTVTWQALESTTASNVGTAGVGIFKQLISNNLEFKKINAGSSKIFSCG